MTTAPLVRKATPDTPDALEEVLNDKARLAELMEDGAAFKTFLADYAKEVYRNDPDLKEQLYLSQKRAMQEFMESNGYSVPSRAPADRPVVGAGPELDTYGFGSKSIYRSMGMSAYEMRQLAATGHGPGVALAGQFESAAEFYKTAWHMNITRNGIDSRLKDLGEGQGDQGGFLVPEEMRMELLRVALESSVVRPRARVIPMTRETLRMPTIRDTSHASTVYGGVTATWEPEAGDLSSATNEPTFSQVQLFAKKLTAYTVAGNELLADAAISLEALLMQMFPEAIAYFEDDAFIGGSGAGQPLGVLNADAMITVAKETGQAATTIVWENIIKMFSRMLPQSLSRAVWYAHIDTFPQLMTMSVAVGTGGSVVGHGNAQAAPGTMLLGRPVIYTEKAQTLGTAGDIVLADFGYYLIGDRATLQVANSPHVKFINDQTVWRFIQRVDGRPWIDSALTPRNGSNTLSPFVDLATRS